LGYGILELLVHDPQRGAPAPNRDGYDFPHALQDEIDASPFSGSVVPSWSQRSIRPDRRFDVHR